MAKFKKFRLLTGSAGKTKGETERLDRFLGLADPGLVDSLRREEQSRRHRFAAFTLLAGALLGATGFWLAAGARTSASDPPTRPAEETARILASHGYSLAWSKQIPKAWSELRLATKLAPRMVEAWDGLALAYFFSGQTEDAVRCLERCLQIEPGYERGFHLLGDISFYSGRYKDAEAYWLKAHAERAIARVRMLEGRMQEAAPIVRKLAPQRPDDHWLQVMAKAVENGQLTPDLQQRLEPGYALSWNPDTARGWRLYYQERYNEASTVFSQVIAGHPDDDSALTGKGWCLLKMASAPEARAYFEGVLGRRPTNYSALNGLGWCLKAEGQTGGALRSWERLWDLRPDTVETPEALRGMGMVYAERGDYARANRYLSECVAKNPEDKEAAKLLLETARKLSPP